MFNYIKTNNYSTYLILNIHFKIKCIFLITAR